MAWFKLLLVRSSHDVGDTVEACNASGRKLG